MNNIEYIVAELAAAGVGEHTIVTVVGIIDVIAADASESGYWEGFIAGREVAA